MTSKLKPIPLLILGDAPDFLGGLSRITRDIARGLVSNPRFRVATLGRGATCSRHLPWHQYAIRFFQGNEWGMFDLQRVWADFAGDEKGILLTIWDPTRTLWLSRPELCSDEGVGAFIKEGRFDLWGYFPIDATGPQNKLTGLATASLLGYSRILAYTRWGKALMERSLGELEAKKRHLDWLPHGLELDKWPIMEKGEARRRISLSPEGELRGKVVGVVGTNQPRKDWGLMASVCQQLISEDPTISFWWHTDVLERNWSIPALIHDFGLGEKTRVTMNLTEEEMSLFYSACDLTLHPGLGEGFGYPIFESLASGVPIIHGGYGGGADVFEELDKECGELIQPEGWRIEGVSNQLRPVFDPKAWSDTAIGLLKEPPDREKLRSNVAHLDWDNLWPMFQRWFEGGL